MLGVLALAVAATSTVASSSAEPERARARRPFRGGLGGVVSARFAHALVPENSLRINEVQTIYGLYGRFVLAPEWSLRVEASMGSSFWAFEQGGLAGEALLIESLQLLLEFRLADLGSRRVWVGLGPRSISRSWSYASTEVQFYARSRNLGVGPTLQLEVEVFGGKSVTLNLNAELGALYFYDRQLDIEGFITPRLLDGLQALSGRSAPEWSIEGRLAIVSTLLF